MSPAGGSCLRSATPQDFNGATACGSLDAANDICQGGDSVNVRGGNYANGTLSGHNGRSSYCAFHAASGETVILSGCSSSAPMCLDIMGDSGYLSLDGFQAASFSGNGIDFGVKTWYGTFDTERGCSHVTFTNLHVGSVNLVCPNTVLSDSELGPSIDNNTKVYGDANPVLIEHNRFHDYDRSNVDQHMECIYLVATKNFTFRRNTVGPCDIIGIHAKEPGSGEQYLNNTLENNLFLPSANGVEYTGYTPCSNLVLRNNIFGDGLIDACSPLSEVGNVYLAGGGPNCSATSYGIFVNVPACGDHAQTATLAQLFVNAAGGDYHPAAGSPAIDAQPTCPADDLDGKQRPIGPACDIGPYEAG